MKNMTDDEIRRRITRGVREYLDDRFVGGFYPTVHGRLEGEPITEETIEADIRGAVEGVIDDLNDPRDINTIERSDLPVRVRRAIVLTDARHPRDVEALTSAVLKEVNR